MSIETVRCPELIGALVILESAAMDADNRARNRSSWWMAQIFSFLALKLCGRRAMEGCPTSATVSELAEPTALGDEIGLLNNVEHTLPPQ
jgi:hypothetical protein